MQADAIKISMLRYLDVILSMALLRFVLSVIVRKWKIIAEPQGNLLLVMLQARSAHVS